MGASDDCISIGCADSMSNTNLFVSPISTIQSQAHNIFTVASFTGTHVPYSAKVMHIRQCYLVRSVMAMSCSEASAVVTHSSEC